MKNHELVPVPLIISIAGLRLGGTHKLLSELLRNKLISHDRQHCSSLHLVCICLILRRRWLQTHIYGLRLSRLESPFTQTKCCFRGNESRCRKGIWYVLALSFFLFLFNFKTFLLRWTTWAKKWFWSSTASDVSPSALWNRNATISSIASLHRGCTSLVSPRWKSLRIWRRCMIAATRHPAPSTTTATASSWRRSKAFDCTFFLPVVLRGS